MPIQYSLLSEKKITFVSSVVFFLLFFALDEMEDYITCELIGGGSP